MFLFIIMHKDWLGLVSLYQTKNKSNMNKVLENEAGIWGC